MPKIKYLKSTLPPVNGLQALFRRYIKAYGGGKVFANKMGLNYDSMRMKIHRGKWTNQETRAWADELGIPASEIGPAIMQR